jgi:hypothetical protein
MSVYPPSPRQRLLNAWTNLYEIWYEYHGTWTLKRWSEGSQSCQAVKYGNESRGTRNRDSLWWRGPAAIYCTELSLLGNSSVNTFLRQRSIVGGVVFYAVHVVSKESRPLVLTRTSCYIILSKGPPIYNDDFSLSLKKEWHAYNIVIFVHPSPIKILNQKSDFRKTWYKHHNCCLLNCDVVQFGELLQTFGRNTLPHPYWRFCSSFVFIVPCLDAKVCYL